MSTHEELHTATTAAQPEPQPFKWRRLSDTTAAAAVPGGVLVRDTLCVERENPSRGPYVAPIGIAMTFVPGAKLVEHEGKWCLHDH